MSCDEVPLRDDNMPSGSEKRRRSVHFDSSSKTVLIPGGTEEGEWRGRGTGHFTKQEKMLVKKDTPSASFSISDETAEQIRFQTEKNRRMSDPTAPTQNQLMAVESDGLVQIKEHSSDKTTGEFVM